MEYARQTSNKPKSSSFHFETRRLNNQRDSCSSRKFILCHSPSFPRQTILIPRKRSSYRGIDHSPAFCSLKFYFAQGKQQIMLESSTSSPFPFSSMHVVCIYTSIPLSPPFLVHPLLATLFFLLLLMELLHKLFALDRGLSLFSA